MLGEIATTRDNEFRQIACTPTNGFERSHNHHKSYIDYLCMPKTFAACLKASISVIRELSVLPDFIACRGMSGAIIAGAVASGLGIPLVLVRKPEDQCHDSQDKRSLAGFQGKTYIIIDDFICSGDTIRETEFALKPSKLLAICLTHPAFYHQINYTTSEGTTIPVLSANGHNEEV
jgi:phosphoribosylpyrophosphate synthetase